MPFRVRKATGLRLVDRASCSETALEDANPADDGYLAIDAPRLGLPPERRLDVLILPELGQVATIVRTRKRTLAGTRRVEREAALVRDQGLQILKQRRCRERLSVAVAGGEFPF